MKQKMFLKQDGFTLVEIIVSIAILSVVCVVFLKLFTLASQVSSNASEVDQASIHASNVLELIKSQESINLAELIEPYNGLKQVSGTDMIWEMYFTENWQVSSDVNLWKYKMLVTKSVSENQGVENGNTQLVHIKVEILKQSKVQEAEKSIVFYETDLRIKNASVSGDVQISE